MTFLETDPVELVRGEEHAVLQHVVELEVLLDLVLVELVGRLLDLPGIELPVPRRKLDLILVRELLHRGGFALGLVHRRRHHIGHQLDRTRGCLRHLVFERVIRKRLRTEQLRPLRAQFGDARDRRARVVVVAVLAAIDRGLEQLLARRAIGERFLGRLLRRVLQCNQPFAIELARLGGLCRCGDVGVAQAGERIAAVEFERAGFRACEQLGAERGAERRQLLVQFAQRRLVARRQFRTRAHEVAVVALDQTFGFRIEAERVALRIKRFHPRKELGIEKDRVAMRGLLRCLVLLHLLQGVVGIGLGQRGKHLAHARQQCARALQCDDGVIEGRRVVRVCDLLDFGDLLLHAFVDCGLEVGVLDLVERRRLVLQGAGVEERIFGHRGCGGFGRFGFRRRARAGGEGEAHCDKQRAYAKHGVSSQ